MKNYIATWIYLESKSEKSKYPNNKGDSSSKSFQEVYWKCIVIFFETSLRYNKNAHHILFTNTQELPVINGFSVEEYLKKNNIELVVVKNKYPLPNDYFSLFRNQFFEFSIIDAMAKRIDDNDGFLLLDSDCVFSKSTDEIFKNLEDEESAITYIVDLERKYQVHGVTGEDMKAIFADLGVVLNENPYYCGGEVLLSKGSFLKTVSAHFPEVFEEMLDRNKKHKIKFNEEAHTLSYYYYKHNANMDGLKPYIKRIWTNRNYFRNVEKGDENLTIWHLPNEKNTGISNLFVLNRSQSLSTMDEATYQTTLFNNLLRKENYTINWYQKFKNFVNKMSFRLGLKSK